PHVEEWSRGLDVGWGARGGAILEPLALFDGVLAAEGDIGIALHSELAISGPAVAVVVGDHTGEAAAVGGVGNALLWTPGVLVGWAFDKADLPLHLGQHGGPGHRARRGE